MRLLSLLQDTTLSVESLKDYYYGQIEKIKKEEDKKLVKYLPGVMIDRYLFAMGSGHPELLEDEFGKESTELAEQIIRDLEIEDNEDSFSVIYRLDNIPKEMERYEFNPKKAVREFEKITARKPLLNNSALMMLLIKYEEMIMGVFRWVIRSYPEAYLSDKKISYSEILEIDSQIDSVKEILVNQEIDEIMRKPISDWYKILNEKHKINFGVLSDYFDEFKEVYYRRNIVVHNNGVVNNDYIKSVKEEYRKNVKKGEFLEVEEQYLKKSFDIAYIMLYGTILCVAKLSSSKEEIYDSIEDMAFQHMIDGEWKISKFIYKYIMEECKKELATADYERIKINYWLSIKNMEGLASIQDEVKKYDVSAMEGKYKVAKACLLDEYNEINRLLENYLGNEVRTSDVEYWPLFLQYRKNKAYKEFKKNHIAEFSKHSYNAENIVREDMEDEILEKADMI